MKIMTNKQSAIVQAFLDARKCYDNHADAWEDDVDAQFACGAYEGMRQRVLGAQIKDSGHAAVAAILLAEELSVLPDQYSTKATIANGSCECSSVDVIRIDYETRHLFQQLSRACLSLWRYHDGPVTPEFAQLADRLGPLDRA